MGVVYEVWDRERRQRVALKTLGHVSASAIYDLKQEFRALADLRHPNVVSLYEVSHDDDADQWFFTMELVEGVSFLRYVTAPPAEMPHPARPAGLPPLDTSATRQDSLVDDRLDERPAGPDEPKLRAALAGLVTGVSAIHQCGKLHRDIKPSNVLVTAEGRVVILDFGLVQLDERPSEIAETSLAHGPVVGTPAYMAPEQAAGRRAGVASDWYAVGVMLYRALSGKLPFGGSVSEVLRHKQEREPPPLARLAPEAPKDLSSLCMRLLRRDPQKRAGEAELRAALLLLKSTERRSSPPRQRSALFGRADSLGRLAEALEESRHGVARCVFVGGEGGVGKSALLSEFARQLRYDQPEAVILSARCYPRESLPFKAFDGLIDELSQILARMDDRDVIAVLPRNRRALHGLFPVLERAKPRGLSMSTGELDSSGAQRRRAAFAALKDLLGRLSDRAALVLLVDNLEFADDDSAALLASLCSAPDPPGLLFAGSFRIGSPLPADWKPWLSGEHERVGSGRATLERLSPLSPGDSLELCRVLFRGDEREAVRVARESGGNPLLMTISSEREPAASPPPDDERPGPPMAPLSAHQALAQRLSGETAEGRRVLEAVAVAGAPLSVESVGEVAALEPGPLQQAIGELVAGHLLEVGHRRARTTLTTRHDLIAQEILRTLSDGAKRNLHRRIAKALALHEPDPERQAHHFSEARLPKRARPHWLAAAKRATEAMAFHRAEALYRHALDLTPPEDRAEGLVALADVLVQQGEPAAAANNLREAARLAPGGEASTLRKRASDLELTDQQLDALFKPTAAATPHLFDGIARAEVQQFLARGTVVEALRGDRVAEAGRGEPSVLLVLSGEVALDSPQSPITLQAGELLGAVPFLQSSGRQNDVYATVDGTRVLALTRAGLDALSETQPRLALQLTVNLARFLCSKLLELRARALGAGS